MIEAGMRESADFPRPCAAQHTIFLNYGLKSGSYVSNARMPAV
jgi:hypothetical protein